VFYSLSNFIIHDSVVAPSMRRVKTTLNEDWIMQRETVLPVMCSETVVLLALNFAPHASATMACLRKRAATAAIGF